MVRTSTRYLIIVSMFASTPAAVMAKFTAKQNISIAIVDGSQLFNGTTASDECLRRVQRKKDELERDLTEKMKKLDAAKTDHKAKEPTLTKEAIDKAQKEIAEMERKCQIDYHEGTTTLEQVYNREQRNLAKIVGEAATEFRQANKVDIVLEKDTGHVLSANPDLYATDEIRKIMEAYSTKPTLSAPTTVDKVPTAANKGPAPAPEAPKPAPLPVSPRAAAK